MNTTFQARGEIRGYIRDAATGEKIAGSDFRKSNAINAAFLYALAARLGGGANETRFLQTGSGDAFDTIALHTELGQTVGCQEIARAAGGDGSVSYVEFRGVYTAAGLVDITNVYLAKDFSPSGQTYSVAFASAGLSKSLLAGQELVIYWRITFSAA